MHYLGDDNDSFTKEQMQQSSKQQFIDQTRLADDIDTKISLDKRPTIFPKPQSVLDRIEQAKADAKHQATTAATPAARGGGANSNTNSQNRSHSQHTSHFSGHMNSRSTTSTNICPPFQ